jgi:uncharacterized protein YecT (DUF1311 family)
MLTAPNMMKNISTSVLLMLLGFSPLAALADRMECRMDVAAGAAHPFGRRASIYAREYVYPAGTVMTEFIYEQLPTTLDLLASDNARKFTTTIEQKRTLTFVNADLEAARKALLKNKMYYEELINMKTDDGFIKVDRYLKCSKPSIELADKEMDEFLIATINKMTPQLAGRLRQDQKAWEISRTTTCKLEAELKNNVLNGENYFESCMVRTANARRDVLNDFYSTVDK